MHLDYVHITDWLERLMLPCLFKLLTHQDCPGCGFQRSVLLLLKGELNQSLHLYWATVPILFLLSFCGAHLHFHFRQGAKILVFLYCCISVLILTQYIYKLSTHF